MSLSGDLITQVLGRVDGPTLASAGCVSSHFRSIAQHDLMWENACCSLWPSTTEKDAKDLISSSLCGFRKFYADCFPLIAYDLEKLNVGVDLHAAVPSDFVSVVDVHYNNHIIYSKVVWGFPPANDFQGWFFKCPFRIDLIHYSESEFDNHTELPAIMCVEKQSKDDLVWVENIRLSWIMINQRTGRAANLSSWRALSGGKHWPSEREYAIRFGSILPTHDILPCKAVQCVIEMKCRVFDGDVATMKISELNMQLEDMMGVHLQGSDSLLILQNALGCCKRSTKHIQILKSHEVYAREQRKLKEAKERKQGLVDTVCSIVRGSVTLMSASYLIVKVYDGSLCV